MWICVFFFSCRDCIFPGERSHTFSYGLTKTPQTRFPEWWRKSLRWCTVRHAGLWCLFTIFCSSFWLVDIYLCDKDNGRIKNLTLTKKNINEKSLWSAAVSTFCAVSAFLTLVFPGVETPHVLTETVTTVWDKHVSRVYKKFISEKAIIKWLLNIFKDKCYY